MNRECAADTLLIYLNIVGEGDGPALRDAAGYCFDGVLHYLDVARRYSALGDVEVDWDGERLSWRAAPPAFFRIISDLGAEYRLCGLLSPEQVQLMNAEGVVLEKETVEFLRSFSITRFKIRTNPSDSTVSEVFRRLGIPYHPDLCYDLGNRLPPLSNIAISGAVDQLSGALDVFDVESRRFVHWDDFEIPSPALFRRRGLARPHYFIRLESGNGDLRRVDLSVGLWLALRHDGSIALSHRGDELTLPRFPELPSLYDRWLTFSGARRTTLLGTDIVSYRPVDESVARRLAQKLGITLMVRPKADVRMRATRL